MIIISYVLAVTISILAILCLLLLVQAQKLRNQVKSFTSLVDSLPIGMLVIDANYQIKLVNPYLKDRFKKSDSESLKDFVSYSAIREAMQIGAQNIIIKLGTAAYRGVLIKQHIQRSLAYFVFYIPAESNEKEIILQPSIPQMQLLRDMALGLAHELRNPIASIKMLLEMAGTKNQDNIPLQFKQVLGFELERLDTIIGDFLHFADLGDLYLQLHNINEIIDEVVDIIYQNYPDIKFKLKKELYPVPRMLLDRKKIMQVFMNIIINAIQALPEFGGNIEIRTRRDDHMVYIQISDDGSGIRGDIQDKIFFPFFTTKKDGVGLGLSITQKIIQDHEGIINFYSKSGKTTFTISLPVKTGQDVE